MHACQIYVGKRYTPVRYTPVRCTPRRYAYEMHVYESSRQCYHPESGLIFGGNPAKDKPHGPPLGWVACGWWVVVPPEWYRWKRAIIHYELFHHIANHSCPSLQLPQRIGTPQRRTKHGCLVQRIEHY